MEVTHLQELNDVVNRINFGTPDAYPFKKINLPYTNKSLSILGYNVVTKTIFLHIEGFTQDICDEILKTPALHLMYFTLYLLKKHKINLPDWEVKYYNNDIYDGTFHLKNIYY